MNQEAEVKIGKKFALHIPEVLAKRLDLREGGKMSLCIEGDKLILEPIGIRDAVELAVKGKKFASLSFEEVEKISKEEQGRYENPP
ncbi:MAG: AbrB/MazE/SpoVT family DNA-binding domain-containing protein [Candidatus Syntrophoarchaeum sp.]|nr:AbrB/MazE/SpoVT family DNA-binding domain-containing protein [Candidatus Syntrophoarchaeum sp.]